MAGTVVADTLQSSITGTPVQFNDGTGTQIGTLCRAWVNFNGTGTVAIRASFNVTSITDNGTGDYTVNFTTAMPDANYATVATSLSGYADSGGAAFSQTTTQTKARSIASTTGALQDSALLSVSVFR
jgi:hypothetical protein